MEKKANTKIWQIYRVTDKPRLAAFHHRIGACEVDADTEKLPVKMLMTGKDGKAITVKNLHLFVDSGDGKTFHETWLAIRPEDAILIATVYDEGYMRELLANGALAPMK